MIDKKLKIEITGESEIPYFINKFNSIMKFEDANRYAEMLSFEDVYFIEYCKNKARMMLRGLTGEQEVYRDKLLRIIEKVKMIEKLDSPLNKHGLGLDDYDIE